MASQAFQSSTGVLGGHRRGFPDLSVRGSRRRPVVTTVSLVARVPSRPAGGPSSHQGVIRSLPFFHPSSLLRPAVTTVSLVAWVSVPGVRAFSGSASNRVGPRGTRYFQIRGLPPLTGGRWDPCHPELRRFSGWFTHPGGTVSFPVPARWSPYFLSSLLLTGNQGGLASTLAV